MTVRASFTFRNQGGAPATGVRVRFSVPEGLMYLVGTGMLDSRELDDEQGNSPLLSRSGAHIGDVAPNEERRIDISYSVAGAIENGSTIEIQAAVAAFELAPVGSNVARLIAHSKPALDNAQTGVTIDARHEAEPGSELTVNVRVHNAGESSAHDVVVVSPIPEHSTYVANSARVNGREIDRDLGASFERIHAPVIAKNLPAGGTVTLAYRIRVNTPLASGTPIEAHVRVASQETPPFELSAARALVAAAPNFDDDQTACSLEPAHEVQPGTRIAVRMRAFNSGTTAADNARVALTYAEGLVPVRGSARIDGRPLRDRKKETLTYDIGRIEAREALELITEAVVTSPSANAAQLPVTATLSWDGGERRFERVAVVRSEPVLPQRKNVVTRASRFSVAAGDECEAVIAISNDGSAPATDAVLQLRVDPALEDVRVTEKGARLALEDAAPGTADSIDLGTIEPYSSRRFSVRARVRAPYADRAEIRLAASLHAHELGETQLGEAVWCVDSHPAFNAERSTLGLISDDVFRPNQLADVFVRLYNEGTDVAQDVRLRLYVSPEARLESVDGATREKTTLLFGEIAPGASAEARLGLRLLRSLAKEHPVTLEGVLTANAMLPTQLHRLTLVTAAEPDFAVATFRSEPADIADVGESIEYVLHVRNGGDGPARKVQIQIDALESLIYVPNSTTVNDVAVRDVGASAPFVSERGIVLNDVDPGIEATIRWRDVVHNGLPAGEAIVRTAHIRYDGDRSDDVRSNEVKVRSAPAFANNIPGLPFGLDGMAGPALGGQRAIAGTEFVELPPAVPVAGSDPYAFELTELRLLPAASHNGSTNGSAATHAPVLQLALTVERLEKTLRYLKEARFGGLIGHLFAIRAFFPDTLGASDAPARERDVLQETLDRPFIKLRIPNYVLAERDIETSVTRSALISFLGVARDAAGDSPAVPAGARVLRGALDRDELSSHAERLQTAPLGVALPWLALAQFIPDGEPEFANYRSVLISALSDLAALDSADFMKALQRNSFPVLDAALDVVRASLRNVRV